MKTTKYLMTPKEYWEMEMYGLKNIKNEFKEQYLDEAKKRLLEYIVSKEKFEKMNDDEKRKIILEDLIMQTKRHSNELLNINYLLRFEKFNQNQNLMISENDMNYNKTQYILYELKEKIKHFVSIISDKSNITKTKHSLNPPLTIKEINGIAFQMMLNELFRLEYNITNYNFFLNLILSFKDSSHKFEIDNSSFKKIKVNCLMFLLNCDYELNRDMYVNYKFSQETSDSIIVRKSTKDNGNGQMIKDRFTIKAESKEIQKIIRDAASHGEYYYQENSIIKVENSEDIPRISMNISFEELYDFIISNLSNKIKEKYKWIFSIIKSDNIYNFISVNNKNETEISKQILVLSLFNIVQYNLQHHFNDIDMLSQIDLSMFNFKDRLNGNIDITQDLSEYDKLLNVKNAIGHGNIYWEDDKLLLENRWIRKRNNNNNKNKDIMCTILYDQLLDFISQQCLYRISTISQSEYDMYELNAIDYKTKKY